VQDGGSCCGRGGVVKERVGKDVVIISSESEESVNEF